MFEYLDEMQQLWSKKVRTNLEDERLKELMIREKIEGDIFLHPEDY